MFAYKLTIKTRKSRKAKLEKFITALESSDLTKSSKTTFESRSPQKCETSMRLPRSTNAFR